MLAPSYNSNTQGDLGLGAAIAYYTSQHCFVSIPLTDTQSYDLIVDVRGHLKRVQVKTTRCLDKRRKNSSYKINFGFRSLNFDLLFVLTENGKQYEVPLDKIITKKNTMLLPGKYYAIAR